MILSQHKISTYVYTQREVANCLGLDGNIVVDFYFFLNFVHVAHLVCNVCRT